MEILYAVRSKGSAGEKVSTPGGDTCRGTSPEHLDARGTPRADGEEEGEGEETAAV